MNPTQIFQFYKDLNIFRKLEKKKQDKWAKSARSLVAQHRRDRLVQHARGPWPCRLSLAQRPTRTRMLGQALAQRRQQHWPRRRGCSMPSAHHRRRGGSPRGPHRESRRTCFGVSPPQVQSGTAAHRDFGGGNARKPRAAPASLNAVAAQL
jgi:hypothetical protein